VGLCANLVSARFLSRTSKKNLNVRAALLHVLGDALASIAAIGAGIAMLVWDIRSADATAGLVIAFLLVANAFRLVRDSVDILLEGAPGHLDLRKIAAEVCQVPGVTAIHDLHIWTVSEGFLAMSAHVDLEPGASPEQVRRAVHRLLHQDYDIVHTTIQTEEAPGLLSIEANPE
jgi:cobalt-zinc-cadmium efflux system protein